MLNVTLFWSFMIDTGSLVLLFEKELDMSNVEADTQFALWSGVCYVMPLFGGWVADSYFGECRHALAHETPPCDLFELLFPTPRSSMIYWGVCFCVSSIICVCCETGVVFLLFFFFFSF